jgi:hypothetical protein
MHPGQAVPSPLDVIGGKAGSRVTAKAMQKRNVGKLRFHFKPEPVEGNRLRSSKVTIGIEGNPRPVYLPGIIAREVRRGKAVCKWPRPEL